MTYRDRRLAKVDRLRGWAEKRETRATTDFERASTMADAIPFGQPIIVGHYSEGRDRRYRDRIGATMDRAVDSQRKAESMSSRADEIERQADHAIYSDDPDAIERLEVKLAGLEAERDQLKRYNASCRKGQRDVTILSDYWQRKLVTIAQTCPYQLRDNGALPAYASSNLSGVIATTRKRLESLRRGDVAPLCEDCMSHHVGAC